MTAEEKDALRFRNAMSECGGMPGIPYRVCGSCGNCDPITPSRKRRNPQ